MAETAAFFDLDRTLLLGASGPIISNALRDHGVIGEQALPVEKAAFAIFDLIGETLPSILLARQAAQATKGWRVDKVQAAARSAAADLVDRVEPFARQAILEHRAAGRKLVLATTTPHDLVRPFAELMGFDDVLATRLRIDQVEAVYDGSIDGEFVWSRGKARSVKAWATANLVELADSYAYSDSFFDVPMLSLVGYPVAVNPDPRLLVYATTQGWPNVWFNAPPGVPKPFGVEPQRVLARLVRPELLPWIDMDIVGLEHLADGPVVAAANHRSYLDPLVVAYAAARIDRPVRFLAKKEVTDMPLVGRLARMLGAIRVDREGGGQSLLIEAAAALRAGELVAVFPQGTIPRGHEFFEPVLSGRHGAVRLALDSGAPLVPIGIWGTERAWPRNARLPYVMNLADKPTVSVVIGRPYRPTTTDPDLATEELMERIIDLLPDEARREHTPTEAELARTYPLNEQR